MDELVVTEEQCKTILVRYLKQSSEREQIDTSDEKLGHKNETSSEQNRKDKECAKLTSFCTHPIDNQYDGLIGEQFSLTIEFQQKDKQKANFFMKILSKSNPLMYDIAKEIRAFEKESFFYEKYVPYLREEGFACDYVPKSYFFESEIIVLENLKDSHYKPSGKNVSLDVEHCNKCLETIARFHSDSVLFELKKSKELTWEYKLTEAFPEMFEDDVQKESNVLVVRYYKNCINGLKKLIELLPGDSIETEEFIKIFDETIINLPATQAEANKKFKNVVSHNDLWCSNILYKYEEVNDIKKVVSCKLVDFQTINLKPPIVDVLGFIYLNTRKSFRDLHMVDLIRHYLRCFSENIERAGYKVQDILSFREFHLSFEYLRVTCKIHCIIDKSFTLIPDDLYVKHLQTEEMFSNFMFEGRSNVMVELFKNNEVYREIMTEELCELRTLLFTQRES